MKKIALLICDHVNPQYQEEHQDYLQMFELLLPDFEFIPYEVMSGAFPTRLGDYDAFMATGSRHSVYEELEWINNTIDFIQQLAEQGKCFVGVCFGHQLLGKAMGGVVEKSDKGWCIGVHTFKIEDAKPWMEPSLDKINLLMMCQDQIVELPPGAERLASSDMCKNALIQIDTHMLGIQAHPEFSKSYDEVLMTSRVNLMGKETVENGIKSLDQDVHKSVIAEWIRNFINQQK